MYRIASFSITQSGLYFIIFPAFVMALNSARVLKLQKSASIHHKSNPYGSSGSIKALKCVFCKKIIHIYNHSLKFS